MRSEQRERAAMLAEKLWCIGNVHDHDVGCESCPYRLTGEWNGEEVEDCDCDRVILEASALLRELAGPTVDRDRLAREIFAFCKGYGYPDKKPGQWNKPIVYGMNVNNPVVRQLWQEYRDGCREGHFPAGDVERLRWEIGLLDEAACEEIEKRVEERMKGNE